MPGHVTELRSFLRSLSEAFLSLYCPRCREQRGVRETGTRPGEGEGADGGTPGNVPRSTPGPVWRFAVRRGSLFRCPPKGDPVSRLARDAAVSRVPLLLSRGRPAEVCGGSLRSAAGAAHGERERETSQLRRFYLSPVHVSVRFFPGTGGPC